MASIKKIIALLFIAIVFVACKKIPTRMDMSIKLKSIDGVAYTGNNQSIPLNKNTAKIFEFEFTAPKTLKEYKAGFDFTQDQSNYLTQPATIGSTGGTFKFKMDVNALISNENAVNNKVQKLFKITLVDKTGTLGNYNVTIEKVL